MTVFAALLMCLLPPVDAPIAEHFREPACEYCAGQRGIEYRTRPGSQVVAARSGVVSFAGPVAGRRFVVVDHGDGTRATYGDLQRSDVRRGDRVPVGERLGTTSDQLYFGLRHGDRYVDPAPFLATARARPHLVPLDGRRRRPGRPARISCPQAVGPALDRQVATRFSRR